MNPGGNDPFQGGGWPGNQPTPPQSPWPAAGPPQNPAASPYPPPPMPGGQWQAGQPGPWNAPPMMNPPYGQPPNNNKGPWIIGGVIAAAVVLVLAIVLVAELESLGLALGKIDIPDPVWSQLQLFPMPQECFDPELHH